jgi:hypothetical protein
VLHCARHTLTIDDPLHTVCCNFLNESNPQSVASLQTAIDPASLYLWIENPVTQQLELAALASFDFVRSWSIDEQRSMRAKRTQLRQFFKRSQH